MSVQRESIYVGSGGFAPKLKVWYIRLTLA